MKISFIRETRGVRAAGPDTGPIAPWRFHATARTQPEDILASIVALFSNGKTASRPVEPSRNGRTGAAGRKPKINRSHHAAALRRQLVFRRDRERPFRTLQRCRQVQNAEVVSYNTTSVRRVCLVQMLTVDEANAR